MARDLFSIVADLVAPTFILASVDLSQTICYADLDSYIRFIVAVGSHLARTAKFYLLEEIL